MKKIIISIGVGFMLLSPAMLYTQQDFKTLDAIKVDGDTVVMTLSGQSKYRAFKIENPSRLIVEVMNTEFNARKEIIVNGALINRIRGGQFKNEPVKVARIVIDLKKSSDYHIEGKGQQIRINLINGMDATTVHDAPKTAPSSAANSTPGSQPVAATATVKNADLKKSANSLKTETSVSKTSGPKASQPAGDLTPVDSKVPKISVVKPAEASPAETAQGTVSQQMPVNNNAQQGDAVEVIAQPVESETADKTSKTEPKKTETQLTSPKNQVNSVSDKQALPAATGKQQPAKEKKAVVNGKNDTAPSAARVLLPKKPVTLDFEDVDIRDVFRVLSMKSGVNIIYGNDVSGTITVRLENVPFDKAFETILSLKNLVSQEQAPNILRIVTPQKISDERAQAVTFTKIFPLNYAKAEEVKTNLDNIRNAEGRRGNVSVDDRTNSLIVTDTPEGLASVESIISELDKKPQQVIIEARIVEITLTNNLDLGINWNYARTIPTSNGVLTVGQSSLQTTDSQGTGGTTVNGEIRTADGAIAGGTGVSFPASAVSGQLGAIAFGLVEDSSRLSGMITALAQKGLSKILSNPKVTTINNKQARILVGQKIPYTTTTVAVSGTTQQTNFLDVGVKLSVTPTINVNRKITLNVHPEVSLFVRADAAGPVIGTREAETTVIVNNGETVVIGGLITENDQKLGTQVPLLGDLPIIGHLFKRDYNTKERTELLVFLTPQIIE